jgi:hypothetical protein
LKPAGGYLGPAIPAADKAIGDGSIDKAVKLPNDAIGEGLRRHFHAAFRVATLRRMRSGRGANSSISTHPTSNMSCGFGWTPLRPLTVIPTQSGVECVSGEPGLPSNLPQ